MDVGVGWQTLPDFEDKVLFHLVDIAGPFPLKLSDSISDWKIAERLFHELNISEDFPESIDYDHSDVQGVIYNSIFSLNDQGLVDADGSGSSAFARPTRSGRDRVAAWRRAWEQNLPKRDRIIQRYLLEELDRQRRSNPMSYKRQSHIDVEKFCAELGISQDEYFVNAERLLDQQKIAVPGVMGMHIHNGHISITQSGVSALEANNTTPNSPSPSIQQAYVEVARLRKQLAVAETNITTLINDNELRRRCLELLSADSDYDRAIREASVILEDRVRNALGNDGKGLIGSDLMNKAFRKDNPFFRLSDHPNEQQGAQFLYSGMMGFFRNKVGHQVIDTYTQADAIRFVAWVDLLLQMVAKASATT